ncbi:hypothetical protein MLD38_022085 [Melastoma candidum]|uniref:Uncharacterized protein n=1 Tax=Melastoma candidum TaxID=119954 RepID=A0ACB9QIL4_9MYRT|nr:hypothetical protein MLD38_022085 [Melastoma candidum]
MSGKRRWDAQGILIVPGDKFDCMDLDTGHNHVLGMVEKEEETKKRMKVGGKESNGLTFPAANVSVTPISEQQQRQHQQQQMQDKCKGSDKEVRFFYEFF